MPRQPYDPRNPGKHNLSAGSYDPGKLLADVIALLEDRGVSPVAPEGRARVEAETIASQLLRSLSLMPAMAPEDALDLDGGVRYDSRLHND